MNLACTVCYEILKSLDNIHAAPCGHLLHYHCWMGWLARMQNCPECRKPTQPSQLIRLFFNSGEGDDYCLLKNKYDSLRCELQCKIAEVQTCNALLEKQKGEVNNLKITHEKEWQKYRSVVQNSKRQARITQDRLNGDKHRLNGVIKILKIQMEESRIHYQKLLRVKETKEKQLKHRINALEEEKEMLVKSKYEDQERLREEQKTNLQFLQQFCKGSEKLMEKLLFLHK